MASDESEARARELFAHYRGGMFTLNEPKRDVEKRLDRAIDVSIASLPLATRLIGKPLLKAVAMIPESLEFAGDPENVRITFARKLVLEAPLNGEARHQKVITGASANVAHRTRAGALETFVFLDAGAVTNRYELDGDTLIGSVHMESQHLPKPIVYSVRMTRRAY